MRVALFVVLLSLVSARDAGAAGTECWGTWRFDVSRPRPDQEQWLAPDSWCRGAKLPRTFTAEARPGPDGRGILTGAPLRLLDVMKGSGRCEFQFSGPPAVAPRYYELSIDVNASGAVVEGKAHCAERTRESEDKSTGVAVDIPVAGGHSAAAGTPVPTHSPASAASGADRQAAAAVAACRHRDADALWKAMTPRFRSELDDRAAQVRRAAAADLRRLFGYQGRPQDFKGLAYLRSVVNGEDSSTNPCWRADQWKLSPAVASSSGYVVPVERDDVAMGFTFTKNDRDWQLDQMSKWARVPKR